MKPPVSRRLSQMDARRSLLRRAREGRSQGLPIIRNPEVLASGGRQVPYRSLMPGSSGFPPSRERRAGIGDNRMVLAREAGSFGFPHVIASAAWQSRRRSNDGSPARAQPQRDCHVAALLAMTTERPWRGRKRPLTVIAIWYSMYCERWGGRDTPPVTNRGAMGPSAQEVGSGFADHAEP